MDATENGTVKTDEVVNSTGDIRLYVKAGADGQRYGACPFCQRVFMILLLKSRRGHLKFKVATVNPSKPPDEFRQLGLKHLPALVHGDLIAFDNVDDIVQYVEEVFPDVHLGYEDPLADNACKNVFSKFCFFIKEVSKDPANLLAELTKLDAFLERRRGCRPPDESEYSFVCGPELTHLDCELLPKLQHLRVASAALMGLELPVRLAAIWRYLHAAYSNDVFVESCPADQEIVLHWVDKPGTPKLTFEQHAALAKETAKYSLDVPAVARPINIT